MQRLREDEIDGVLLKGSGSRLCLWNDGLIAKTQDAFLPIH
jgi:hypothetical protein